MSKWLFAPTLWPVILSFVIAFALTTGTRAQTHSTIHNGWRITTDESPSSEFVAQSVAALLKSFEPHAPTPSLPWCCGVGNYGGEIEDDDNDLYYDKVPFYRLTDDIPENSVSIFVWPNQCDRIDCQPHWAIGGEFESYQSVFEVVAVLIDLFPNEHPAAFAPPPILAIDQLAHAVFVGEIGPEHPLPQVWSLTISATPEPTTLLLWIISMSALGLVRRRH